MVTPREHSLRRHVWRVVALIALAPLLFITLGVPLDHWMRDRLQSRADAAVEACADAWSPDNDCSEIAEDEQVWLRVWVEGEVEADHDAGTQAAVGWIEQLMDPEARFWLQQHDPFRDDLQRDDGCGFGNSGSRLLVCTASREIDSGGTVTIRAVAGDVRSVRALSADGVTKLVLEVLLVALLVGWWLGRRIIDPIEHLRNQVLERVGSSPAAPVDADDPTEVGEVAAAFNELVVDLERRRRANQEFAADLAHELKNPVATILSLAENLEDADELSDAQVARYASVLRRSGEQLNGLIQDFLDLARAEAGLEHTDRTPLRLDELVEAVAGRLADDPRFEDRQVECKTESASVRASNRHLEIALGNVIENALQVVGPGGAVSVVVRSDGATHYVEVHDDGPGIDEEHVPDVFDRFFSRRKGGTGLGLPLSRAVTRAHGGDLTVESVAGEGTTFTFALPSHESHTETIDE